MTGPDIVTRSNALLASGRKADAVALVEQAAARHDPDALFQQAIWRLIGDPLPRDLAGAVQLFGKARQYGHGDAALIEIALIANGTGGTADFANARRLLDQAAQHDSNAAYLRDLLSQMALSEDGSPSFAPPFEPLDETGLVRRYPKLLTEAECTHIARSSGDLLAPALVVDPNSGRQVPHPVRTSDGAVIGPTREDLVIRAINLRVASITATAVAQGEALAVLRYRPGQQFRLHSDAIPGARNQRIMTALIYLNEGFGGGETGFPELGLTVTPRAGDAIVYANVRDDGSADPRLRHAGLPVKSGVKWLATRWIRAAAVDPWTMPV